MIEKDDADFVRMIDDIIAARIAKQAEARERSWEHAIPADKVNATVADLDDAEWHAQLIADFRENLDARGLNAQWAARPPAKQKARHVEIWCNHKLIGEFDSDSVEYVLTITYHIGEIWEHTGWEEINNAMDAHERNDNGKR